MSQSAEHCPFLNRSDARCSQIFNLRGLEHAYKFCFGNYETCPRYQQLLSERQGKRSAAVHPQVLVQISHIARTPRRRTAA